LLSEVKQELIHLAYPWVHFDPLYSEYVYVHLE